MTPLKKRTTHVTSSVEADAKIDALRGISRPARTFRPGFSAVYSPENMLQAPRKGHQALTTAHHFHV